MQNTHTRLVQIRPGSRSRSRKSWAAKYPSRVARAAKFFRLYY